MLIRNHHQFVNSIKNMPGLLWWVDTLDGYTLDSNGYVATVRDKSANSNHGNLSGGNVAPEITPFGMLCNRGLASAISGNANGTQTMPTAYTALCSARYIDKGDGTDQAGIFTHTSGGAIRTLMFFFLGSPAAFRFTAINTTTTAVNYMQSGTVSERTYLMGAVFADFTAGYYDYQVTSRDKHVYKPTGPGTPNTAPNNTSAFLLGRQNSASANIFQGYIHEVMFFNVVVPLNILTKLGEYLQKKWTKRVANFTPVHITGLHGWWDFSDRRAVATTPTLITSCADKSKNDLDMKQSITSRQYTYTANGRNNLDIAQAVASGTVINFMLNDDASSSTTNDDFTFFFVGQGTFDADDNRSFMIYGDDNGNKRWRLFYSKDNDAMQLNTSADGSTYTSCLFTGSPSFQNVLSGEWAVYEVKKSGTTATLTINGTNYGNTSTAPDATLFDSVKLYGMAINLNNASALGTTEWDGYIAEVIVYNVAITDGEQEAIRNYLNAKWGF